jgi:anti-sigma factor RsiW
MNDPIYQQLCQQAWRRKLSGSEEAELRAWLAAHPQVEDDWRLESGLNEALSQWPDAPLASNFTARVLAEVERQVVKETRRVRWQWGRLWGPRLALAVVVLSAGLLSFQVWRVRSQERERITNIANGIAAITEAPSVPDAQTLADFDAIRALGQGAPPDEELLGLLQ